MASDTRLRILDTARTLFQRHGYAVGLKQVVAQAGAPFGSLYHHFPGGKEQLAEEVIRGSAAYYRDLATQAWDPAVDLPTNLRAMFVAAAQHVEATGYEDACPIATVALEVSSTNERLRLACRDVFAGWIDDAQGLFASGGLRNDDARRLALQFVSTLEGAFVLVRVSRSNDALLVAGELLARNAEAMLETSADRAGDAPSPATLS